MSVRLVRRGYPVLAIGTALGLAIVHAGAVVAVVTPAMFCLLALAALTSGLARGSDDQLAQRRILAWTIGAFFAHLAFGLIVNGLAGAFAELRSDALTYHESAIRIVDSWNTGNLAPDLPAGKEGFYYLLAGLYWVFGAHMVTGLVVNAALAAALVPILTDLTRRLFGSAAARYAGPLIVLMPGVFIWTSQLLKEAGILFLVAVAANAAVRMLERVTLSTLVALTASIAVLLTFRGPVGLVIAAGLVAGIAFGKRQLFPGLSTGLAALALMGVVVVALGFGYSGFQAVTGSDLEQANLVREDLARSADTGFGENVDISTPQGALSYLPTGLLSFGLGPFPWQSEGIGQLAMAPDVIAWWLLLPSLWRGQRQARRVAGRGVLVLLLPAMITSALLALVVSNFGTVVRERAQVVVLLVPIIALGLAQRAAGRHDSQDSDEVPAISLGLT